MHSVMISSQLPFAPDICRSCLQGSMPCCVTGPAFEVLLQADAAVMHAVMSSVAVFARMQGQQKGQVVDLLGRRGLHQTLQGEQRHIPVSLAIRLSCLLGPTPTSTILPSPSHLSTAFLHLCLTSWVTSCRLRILFDLALFVPSIESTHTHYYLLWPGQR